jgi:hypothetical protein
MKLSRTHLPKSAQALIDVIGLDATLILVRRYGGLSLWPARYCAGRAELEALIGAEATERLVTTYREEMQIPQCAEALRVIRHNEMRAEFDGYVNAGASARSAVTWLAAHYGHTERHVWRLLKRSNAVVEVVQGEMF